MKSETSVLLDKPKPLLVGTSADGHIRNLYKTTHLGVTGFDCWASIALPVELGRLEKRPTKNN